jgi:hypothetical protein
VKVEVGQGLLEEMDDADAVVCPCDTTLLLGAGLARSISVAVGGISVDHPTGEAVSLGDIVEATAGATRWKSVFLAVAVDWRAAVSRQGRDGDALVSVSVLTNLLKEAVLRARVRGCKTLVIPFLGHPTMASAQSLAIPSAESLLYLALTEGAARTLPRVRLLGSAQENEVFCEAFRTLDKVDPSGRRLVEEVLPEGPSGQWPCFRLGEPHTKPTVCRPPGRKSW